jgi:isopenicillin-N N-acyltransferase-like protein
VTVYPTITVAGSPRQRGEQYGRQSAERIRRSLDGYRVAYWASGIRWAAARERAAAFIAPIERFDARQLAELEGIAAGSGVDLIDVVALNIRTEVINSAQVLAERVPLRPLECTALAGRRADGSTVVAQNWDYFEHCRETLVVLAAEPDDAPAFVTLVEAGLLAKIGMNACGLALVTNGLATEDDDGAPGVPYHVLVRALIEAESLDAARAMLRRAERRAASGNYLIATADGAIADIEAWSGTEAPLSEVPPDDDGTVVHTNHCLVVPPDRAGAPFELTPTSASRLARARQLVREHAGPLEPEDLQRMLADHVGAPDGICTHADRRRPLLDRAPTCASLVMAPSERLMLLADGPPCETPYRALDAAVLRG